MSIEEFKKTLETIKGEWNNESHSYKNENYFIYIKENDFRDEVFNKYTIYYSYRSI